MSPYELRQQRLNELLDSCQEQMIAAIIGPLGLSKGMFDDINGGSVTTVHNFENGVTATDEDAERLFEVDRNNSDYYKNGARNLFEYCSHKIRCTTLKFRQDGFIIHPVV